MVGPCFVIQYFGPSSFAIIVMVLLQSVSVALPYHHVAVGLSVVCDYGIS